MKSKKNVAVLAKVISHLNLTKLEFLKAADLQSDAETTRFFNQQARLRNHFSQELLTLLGSLDINTEQIVLKRIDFNQRIITPVDGKSTVHIHRCLDLDQELLEFYNQLLTVDSENALLCRQAQQLHDAVNTSRKLLDTKTKIQNQILF